MSKIQFQKVLDIKHIQRVINLAFEIWHEHFIPIIGLAQVEYMLDKFQSDDAISSQIKNGFDYYLFAVKSEYIGYLSTKSYGHKLFLSKLYIKSSERKKGYGKQAIQYLLQLAQNNGLDAITLTVNKDNSNTIKAYQKLGFVISHEKKQDIGGGFVMDDYQMEMQI